MMRRNLLVALGAALVLALALAAAWPAIGQVGGFQSAELSPQAQQTEPDPLQVLGNAAQYWADTQSFESMVTITTSTGSQSDSQTRTMKAHVWYEAPDKLRLEVVEPADGVAQGTTAVYDGNTLWLYQPDQNQVTVIEGTPNVLFHGHPHTTVMFAALQIIRFPQYMVSLVSTSTVRDLGQDTINGQKVLVVSAVPRAEGSEYGVQRFWIDEQSGLPVRTELQRPDGTTFFYLQFEAFNRNVELPADAFTFQVPEGATVQRIHMGETTVSMEWRDVTLEDARQQVDFTILTWEQLPPGTELRSVRLGTADGRKSVELTYSHNGEAQTILLENGAQYATPDLPGAETVQLGQNTAQVMTLGNATQMTWTQSGTRVTMITDLPRDQAIAMARNLGGPMSSSTP